MTEKIKILYGLASRTVGDKSLRKAVETFLWMKFYHEEGRMAINQRSIAVMAAECRISARTMHKRISLMNKYLLVRISQQGGKKFVELESWEKVKTVFEIRNKKFYYVRPQRISKLEHMIIARAIRENQRRQEMAVDRKIKEDDKGNVARHVTGGGLNTRQALLKSSIMAFRYPSSYSPEEMSYLNSIRPDVQLNCRTIAKMIGCSSPSTGTYTKNLLNDNGLIRVTKRRVESEERKRESNIGKVFYNRRSKKTFVILPDLIDVL